MSYQLHLRREAARLWMRSLLSTQSWLQSRSSHPSPSAPGHGHASQRGESTSAEGLYPFRQHFALGGTLTTEFGNAAHHGGEDGLHLILLRPPEASYFARQAAVHKDFVGSKAFMYVTHLCQVLHARGNPLQHANELGGRELSLVLLETKKKKKKRKSQSDAQFRGAPPAEPEGVADPQHSP